MKIVTIITKENPTKKVIMEFSDSTICKMKKDSIKTNYDGSLIMPNEDLIIIHKENK